MFVLVFVVGVFRSFQNGQSGVDTLFWWVTATLSDLGKDWVVFDGFVYLFVFLNSLYYGLCRRQPTLLEGKVSGITFWVATPAEPF